MPAASGTPSYSTTAMNSSSAEIRQAEQQLQNQGFYHGQIDGIIGPETEQAIGQFQQKNGLSQTATLDQPTMGKLLGNSDSSERSSAPTVFHGAGSIANPQPAGSAGNIPKQ
jgi:peptidoglycan hydrolase-like protein with peptidoglycan-binding domain